MKTIGDYAFQVELKQPLTEAREHVVAALKEHGFGVLTEIDVRATLKEKIGVEWPAYRILGVCNPTLAHQALTASPHVGLILPPSPYARTLATPSSRCSGLGLRSPSLA